MKTRHPPDPSLVPSRSARPSRVEFLIDPVASDAATIPAIEFVPRVTPPAQPAAVEPATLTVLPDPSRFELPGAPVSTATSRSMPTLGPPASGVEPPRAAVNEPEPTPHEVMTPLSEPGPPIGASRSQPDLVGPLFRFPLEAGARPAGEGLREHAATPAASLERPASVDASSTIVAPSNASRELQPSELRPSRRGAALSKLDARLQSASRFLDRYPWLMPTLSFSIGWLSFFLFQRGESLARGIAVLALLGWPWLLAENLIGRWVVARSNGRLSISAVRFVTQQIQQEILFFALPFLFGAMVLEPGQMLFVGIAAVIAILVSLDPIYLHRIAPHAGLSSALHAYCTLIAALVVLPVALHLPLDEALPLSLAITAVSLVLSLPRMLFAAPTHKMRLRGCALLAAAFPLMWALRAAIPPAGLWVREAHITDRIDGLEPGRPVEVFGTGSLHASGGIAFVAVRAPTGLSQAVVFDWLREGQLVDRIPAQISGGREAGFRTYSRKQNFPEDSRGSWRVDLRTPQGQLISRMRFQVN